MGGPWAVKQRHQRRQGCWRSCLLSAEELLLARAEGQQCETWCQDRLGMRDEGEAKVGHEENDGAHSHTTRG